MTSRRVQLPLLTETAYLLTIKKTEPSTAKCIRTLYVQKYLDVIILKTYPLTWIILSKIQYILKPSSEFSLRKKS